MVPLDAWKLHRIRRTGEVVKRGQVPAPVDAVIKPSTQAGGNANCGQRAFSAGAVDSVARNGLSLDRRRPDETHHMQRTGGLTRRRHDDHSMLVGLGRNHPVEQRETGSGRFNGELNRTVVPAASHRDRAVPRHLD